MRPPRSRPFVPLVSAVTFLVALVTSANAQDAKPTRRILAIGGGAYAGVDRPLPRYLLSLTGKLNPLVYYLPTAAGDAPPGIVRWYETMNELECRPRHLRLFNDSNGLKNLEAKLLSADAIFVGGGNTMNMLAVWKIHGVDKILRKAWERGTVLAGESAGMICWFEQGITDSRADKLTALDGLGFLKGSACPHYSNEAQRKLTCSRMLLAGELKDGIACDDGAAILYEGDHLARAVSIDGKGKAYRIRREEGKVIEEPVKLEILKRK